MKVLGVINGLGTGGAEKLILETAPLLREKVAIDFLFLEENDYPFEKKFKETFKGNYFFSRWSSVYHPMHIFTLAKKLKNYEVVHVHLFPAFYWVVIAKLITFSKAKVVLTEHSTSNRRMRSTWLKMIDIFMYKLLSAIITISEEVDSKLKNYLKLSKDRFHLIKNGVNLETIKNANPMEKKRLVDKTESNPFIILQVSSFHYPKDQITVIKSLNLLPPNTFLVFAGTGEDLKKSIGLTKALNLAHRVFFLGVRTDIPELLKSADVVVLCSHYEGLSLSSIEGMASGKPFIASDVPGLRKVVQGAGLLFEDGNEKELAGHITKLMNDGAYYNQIAAACQERAQEYDIQKMVDAQVKLYQELF